MAAGLAAMLVALRLWTGIVVSYDSAEVFLVLKHAPSFAVTRFETASEPLAQDIVLDGDEQSLAYEWLYGGLMDAALPLAAALAVAPSVVLRRRGAAAGSGQ